MARGGLAPVDRRPLTERVRPDRLESIVGNPGAIEELRAWAGSWKPDGRPPRFRAAVLEGPPGTGKTTAAIALAHDLGWGLVEMNASDARNRSAIEQVAGRASVSRGLTGIGDSPGNFPRGRTLILLDEADCLFSRGTEAAGPAPAPPTLREFLRGRYGSVETLSAAWGLGAVGAPPAFAEWGAVPVTGGRSAAFRLPSAARDVADWGQTRFRPDYSDRGGLGAIAKLVRETRQPLVLTVNDPRTLSRYSPVFRTSVARIRFWPLRESDLRAVLRRVVVAERFALSSPALDAILRRSHGDLRAALNDLEVVAVLPAGPAQESLLGTRDVTSDFFDFTREVLDVPRVYRSVEIRNRLDATPDDLLPWIEENLPRATRDPHALAAGLDRLAAAELLLSRARRHRVYGLWSFASELMTGGVSLAIASGGSGAPERIAFPQFLGEMGRARSLRAVRLGLLSKIGRGYHLSRRKANEAFLPFLEQLFHRLPPKRPRSGASELQRTVVRELGLTPEEIAYLLGAETEDPRVLRLLEPEEPNPTTPQEPHEVSRAPRRPSRRTTGSRAASARPTSVVPEAAAPEARPEKKRAKAQKRLADF